MRAQPKGRCVSICAVLFALATPVASAAIDNSLRHAIEQTLYGWKRSGAGYASENPRQRLSVQFGDGKTRLAHPGGRVTFELRGHGYGRPLRSPGAARVSVSGNRIEYNRPGLQEWYVNGADGVEQGFTLERRPGRAAGSRKRVSTTASSSEAATTSLLPAALLLKPKAASCDALRNGSYRFLIAKPSASTNPGDPVTTTGNATMDVAAAAGPTWNFGDGTMTLTPVAGENCHYTVAGTDGLTGEFVISPSGYAVGRLSNTWTDGEAAPDAAWRMAIAIPTQAMTLADLAGKWNGFGWEANAAGNIVDPGLVTIDAAGAANITCSTNDPSTPETGCTDVNHSSFVANADGGFDLSFSDGSIVHKLRAWGFRAGNGTTVVTILRADGGVHILTPYRTLSNASVGDTHKAWNVALNNAFVANDPLAYNRFEITGIDTSTGSLTRTVTALATNVSHSQTLQVNKARNGWVYRAAGTAAGSDGSSVTVRAMYSLKLGIGVSAYWLPANNQAGTNSRFAFSVTQP